MKFSEMPYQRPDKDALLAQLADLTARLLAADSFEAAENVCLEADAFNSRVQTLATLVSIRHSIDTRDEFYSGESDWWDENTPLLAEGSNAFQAALFESPYRP